MFLVHLFSVDELKALDEQQLHLLKHYVDSEIMTNPDVLRILGERARARYEEIRAPGRPRRARGPGRPSDPGASR